MTIISKFFNKIETALNLHDSNDEFDMFNDLEDWFIDNEEEIHNQNYQIGQLGYEIQNEIAEMSYMDDSSKYREKIKKIYDRMKLIA